MIDLAREASALFLAWAIGLTVVYGFVESSFPLFVGLRIFVSSRGAPLWWGETLVYCPYCIGFWIQGFVGLSTFGPWWWAFARGACLWIASLLVLRSVFDVELVRSKYGDEIEAIRTMRERRAKEVPDGQ